MARGQSLLSSEPTGILQQPVTIGHVQLRDVLLCPEERGVVNFVRNQTILERDTRDPTTVAYPLANLGFVPNTIASLPIPGSEERLIAAGGQEAELHLSIHSSRPTGPEPRRAWTGRPRRLWQFDNVLSGSINNSVLLTSLSLTRSHESSAEPRVAVSNNDCTVKFYDVNVRGARGPEGLCKRISEAGTLRIDVPVNHSSISPDGRTLLSVGDSPHVYLHALSGGSRITFTELYKLTLPAFDQPPPSPFSINAIPACFSTAFSACGTKFAVASQEGMVVVWDVRSHKPLKVYQTDKNRPSGRRGNGGASGRLYEEAWDWGRPGSSAPGWGVRNVKFSPARNGGKELMIFTEHTSLLHVIDARTFEQEDIISVPTLINDPSPSSSSSSSRPSPQPRTVSTDTETMPWSSHTPRLPPPPPRIVLRSEARRAAAAESATGGPSNRLSLAAASAYRHRRNGIHRRAAEEERTREDPHIVIPPLGDRSEEREVRRVLGRHGIRATVSRAADPDEPMYDAEESGDMDVDLDDAEPEAEFECVTSRAGSPAPAPQPAWLSGGSVGDQMLAARRFAQSQSAARKAPRLVTPPNLDLAGACFDPAGGHVYVASDVGIVEWGVTGACKTWWQESVWA